MTEAVSRKELQGYIETMPERNLAAVKKFLLELSEPLYTIEPASEKEAAMAEKRLNDGTALVPWEEVKEKAARLDI